MEACKDIFVELQNKRELNFVGKRSCALNYALLDLGKDRGFALEAIIWNSKVQLASSLKYVKQLKNDRSVFHPVYIIFFSAFKVFF